MKRIFLDTNFIIDYFIREDFKGDAEKLLQCKDSQKLTFYISFLSVANFAYVMRKLPLYQLKEIIMRICDIFKVVDNTNKQILLNIQSDFTDFEDGLQYQCAMSAKCDCIISRNQKDFSNSEIPVMTAEEFVNSIGK